MLLPLRRSLFAAVSASGGLRLALSTAASDSRLPSWALIHRISGTGPDGAGASVSLTPPPSPSSILVPERVYGLDAHPSQEGCTNLLSCVAHAASADGLLLLTPFTVRYRARPNANLDLPIHMLLKSSPFEVVHQFLYRFVCNPVTGELFRLPDFDDQEKELGDQYLGIITDAAGPKGRPERYAVAQLSDQEGNWGRRWFVLRRFASETGKWDKLMLRSPLPSRRRMHLNHEVVAFRGRLWWMDVSWGAVSVDPFSDRLELRSVQMPSESMRPGQEDEEAMKQLVKRRRLGVSGGRLCYAEVGAEEPYLIKLFTLDEDSGRWTLEHQVPFTALLTRGGFTPAPLLGAIDPLNSGHVYLSIDREFTLAVDMAKKEVIGASALGEVRPTKNSSSFFLPCVLDDGLASYRIPGDFQIL
ncbi:hypothetical protein PR202_gb01524 [Eleusine coracana subsp. coracana]|uniref:F-box protein At3g26010-like beta-propeller domain-containing protein n=1 Tax=Eleusine coracana subsp. coracana TaxID=191504 RepID=A0AAV5DUC5_ELECO|nr:hypothetical protein PR202_gb01524 [Eleusine coracana subsp. coracana]